MIRSNEDANSQQQYRQALKIGAGAAGIGLGSLAYRDGKKFVKGKMEAQNAKKEAKFLTALSEYANKNSASQHDALVGLGSKVYKSKSPISGFKNSGGKNAMSKVNKLLKL